MCGTVPAMLRTLSFFPEVKGSFGSFKQGGGRIRRCFKDSSPAATRKVDLMREKDQVGGCWIGTSELLMGLKSRETAVPGMEKDPAENTYEESSQCRLKPSQGKEWRGGGIGRPPLLAWDEHGNVSHHGGAHCHRRRADGAQGVGLPV